MMRDRGIVGVPIFHNYPHPLGPGGSASGITTPFNLKRLEEKLDFVGFDIYSRRELYDHVKTVVSYVVGTSRFPFIPEFVAGVWPWYLRPGNEYDEEFVTKAAIMNGIKGSSRYMIVERNRWLASPVMRDGTIRPDRYEVFRQANEMLLENRFSEMDRSVDVLLLANRQYDRLEAASVLVSFPGDFLEPILGFSEYPNFMATSEETFGFEQPIQQAKSDWFSTVREALQGGGFDYLLGDTFHPVSELQDYKAILVSSFEFMEEETQEKLVRAAEAGTHVVFGPHIPTLDGQFKPCSTLSNALSGASKTEVDVEGAHVADSYAKGQGKLIHLHHQVGSEPSRLTATLTSVLEGAGATRISRTNSRIDATLHRGEDVRRAVLFLANPTAEAIDVEISLEKPIAEATDLWEKTSESTHKGGLKLSLPAHTIRAYGITFV